MKIQETIESKIRSRFEASHLSLENESHRHAVAPGSETHFKLVLVSAGFENVPLVQRHRQVYELLQSELSSGVHALALHLYTPAEWSKKQAPATPNCLGGSKNEK